MKNTLLLFIVFFSFIGASSAQNPLGDEGFQFSLASGYTINGLPIYGAFEISLLEDITFGVEGNYRAYSEQTDSGSVYHSIAGFSFFGNYYFNKLLKIKSKKWFIYGGLSVGYYKWFSPKGYYEPGNSSSTLSVGAQIGGRYYFNEWGILLEMSGGTENAGGKLGVCYRIDY